MKFGNTVKQMVFEILEKRGADGLVNPDTCHCKKDDLFPCEADFSACLPGYIGPCTCGEDCDCHLYVTREDAEISKLDGIIDDMQSTMKK